MDKGLIFAIVSVCFFIWWWFSAKAAPYRKYILFAGISWLITVIAYVLGVVLFQIGPLALVGIVAFLAFFCFGIKAGIEEYRSKKKSSHD